MQCSPVLFIPQTIFFFVSFYLFIVIFYIYMSWIKFVNHNNVILFSGIRIYVINQFFYMNSVNHFDYFINHINKSHWQIIFTIGKKMTEVYRFMQAIWYDKIWSFMKAIWYYWIKLMLKKKRDNYLIIVLTTFI